MDSTKIILKELKRLDLLHDSLSQQVDKLQRQILELVNSDELEDRLLDLIGVPEATITGVCPATGYEFSSRELYLNLLSGYIAGEYDEDGFLEKVKEFMDEGNQ